MEKNRKTAYDILLDIEQNQAYSNLAVNYHIEKNSPDNQAFVRELVYGVLKNKVMLDYILDRLVASGLKKVKKQDKTLLRMGLYQMIFMNSVPEYAAISETVNMARVLIKGRAGFVNGVLRNWQRSKADFVFPKKEDDLINYLIVKYSVSKWIVKLWLDAYGADETEKLLAASNETPELTVRVNILKTDRENLREKLESAGFEVGFSKYSERALIVKGTDLLSDEAYRQGLFSVQDEASVIVSDMLGAEAGDVVYDVCAAPGGKTFATAEKMKNRGKIVAMDIYEHKLELMKKQGERTGIDCIEFKCHDGTKICSELEFAADKVLCDVPCSGLGVLRRKPEIKYKSNDEIGELIERQSKILQAAAAYLKYEGILVYSTCTINPDENSKQIKKFLDRNNEFSLLEEKQLLPTMGTDGFYICKMKKVQK